MKFNFWEILKLTYEIEYNGKKGASLFHEKECSTGRPSKKWFKSADCDTVYTIYLSLCIQTADPTPFRGTYVQKIQILVYLIHILNAINQSWLVPHLQRLWNDDTDGPVGHRPEGSPREPLHLFLITQLSLLLLRQLSLLNNRGR